MIERLLAAERALQAGELDQAERLFAQIAEADERNAMAVVGLAQVALARGESDGARELAERALAIDPDDAAAARLLATRTQPGVAPEEPIVAAPAEPAVAAPEKPGGVAPDEPAVAPPAAARPSFGTRLMAWIRRLIGRAG